MNATKEKKEPTPEEIIKGLEPEDLVAKKFRAEAGETRRIHELWAAESGVRFRVNFHSGPRNYVTRSLFVVVRDGKAEVVA
jgi:hypothetical protein